MNNKYIYNAKGNNGIGLYYDEAYDTPEEAVEAERELVELLNDLKLPFLPDCDFPVPAVGDTSHVAEAAKVPIIKIGEENGRPVYVYNRYMTLVAIAASKKERHPIDGAEIVCLD